MSDSPFELLRLVTVATFSTPWEAQIAQARLAAEGIHSLIAGEHVIRMVALSNAVGGLQLQVREEDAAAAAEALRGFAPLPEMYLVGHEADAAGTLELAAAESRAPRCPTCGGGDLQAERSSRLVLGVLPVSRKAYRCGACGVLWKPEEVSAHADAEAGAPTPAGSRDGGQENDEDDESDESAKDLHNRGGGQDDGWDAGTTSPSRLAGSAGGPVGAGTAPLAVVGRFHTPWEAHLARTFLESEGLSACVVEERLPAVNLLSATRLAANRLEVRQDDAARATEILNRAWNYPSRVALPDGSSGDGPAGG
jgi:hypothetical protein